MYQSSKTIGLILAADELESNREVERGYSLSIVKDHPKAAFKLAIVTSSTRVKFNSWRIETEMEIYRGPQGAHEVIGPIGHSSSFHNLPESSKRNIMGRQIAGLGAFIPAITEERQCCMPKTKVEIFDSSDQSSTKRSEQCRIATMVLDLRNAE